MEMNRREYAWEYKAEVVKMITCGGASATEVAHDMGIPLKTLYRWIQDLSAKPEQTFSGNGQITSDANEIRKLKREVERLKQECEILKKTGAYAKDRS